MQAAGRGVAHDSDASPSSNAKGKKSAKKRSAKNVLIEGENLQALKKLLPEYGGRIDLIYLDPPFSTNSSFRIGSGRTSTVSSSRKDGVAYEDRLTGSDFIEFLRARLKLLRLLLSDRGSIYLHIDYKVGHYVKILMDEIFGMQNFRNDIARIKCNPKNFARPAYGNIKDMILFYSKGREITWNEPSFPYSEGDISRLYGKIDGSGRRYMTVPIHAPGETASGPTAARWRGMLPPPGRHWRSPPEILDEWDKQGLIEWSSQGTPRKKIFADEKNGKRAQDIWEFKDPQSPVYPTQKSLDLLQFIIQTSSNKGDAVLDPFCGSGTALLAAERLGRSWIGIDSSSAAIAAARQRLGGADHRMITQS